jgi:hypothetical protein
MACGRTWPASPAKMTRGIQTPRLVKQARVRLTSFANSDELFEDLGIANPKTAAS